MRKTYIKEHWENECVKPARLLCLLNVYCNSVLVFHIKKTQWRNIYQLFVPQATWLHSSPFNRDQYRQLPGPFSWMKPVCTTDHIPTISLKHVKLLWWSHQLLDLAKSRETTFFSLYFESTSSWLRKIINCNIYA